MELDLDAAVIRLHWSDVYQQKIHDLDRAEVQRRIVHRQFVEVRLNLRHLAASVSARILLIVYPVSILPSAEPKEILWHATCPKGIRTIYQGDGLTFTHYFYKRALHL